LFQNNYSIADSSSYRDAAFIGRWSVLAYEDAALGEKPSTSVSYCCLWTASTYCYMYVYVV